jgi:hypothetical protein
MPRHPLDNPRQGIVRCAKKNRPRALFRLAGGLVLVKESGEDRLSRGWHYHGPDGLNGRVRNGNGWDPAGMVAGKPTGGRSGHAGRDTHRGSVTRRPHPNACGSGSIPARPGSSPVDGGIAVHETPPRGRHAPAGADGSGWSSTRLLGPVGCGGRPPCTPGLSTWSSSRSLRTKRCWKPRLGGGFALRCLQRLSGPDLATRRCPERDSRHTSGRSSPILSY